MPSIWVPLIWLAGAAVLLTLELSQPSFDGLMFAAIAALLVSAVTAIGPLPVVLQLSAFVVITVVGTVWLMRWSAHRNPDPDSQRQRQDLAEVISPIPHGGEGRVRWHGQSWAAASLELERPLTDGEKVLVVGRDGTQLQVMAASPLSRSRED
jgi:membrane protein implicated in regulation of membrane protease activity